MTQGPQEYDAGQRQDLVPALPARGSGTKVGDTVVLVATNKDGSVNGKTFVVSGILEKCHRAWRARRLYPFCRRHGDPVHG